MRVVNKALKMAYLNYVCVMQAVSTIQCSTFPQQPTTVQKLNQALIGKFETVCILGIPLMAEFGISCI